jgi:hypothetical protein
MGCVKGASDYFDYDFPAPMLFELTGIYRNVARELRQVKEKDVPPDNQEEHLSLALDQEEKAENRIEELVSLLD